MGRVRIWGICGAAAAALAAGGAQAGDPYGYGAPDATSSAAAAPVIDNQPVYEMTYEPEVPRDGFYDPDRFGGNAEFGFHPQSACGGLIEGERCLVILGDHMRRVRLERDAGTILVGNPAIADVTVLGKDTMFVSARSTGSTNIIALDEDGNEIATYEVFVREPDTKRVTLRLGTLRENYQCAPHCERALSQNDTGEQHSQQSAIITTELGIDQQAIGIQAGANPNTDPNALLGAQEQAAAAAAPGQFPGAALGAQIGQAQSPFGVAGAATASGMQALQMIGQMLGNGGAPAAAQPGQAPAGGFAPPTN